MVSANFITPFEVAKEIAKRSQEKRLFFNLSQLSLSERSGVSLGVIKKFERTGIISLESLLKIAVVLDSLAEFAELFKPPLSNAPTLEVLMKQKKRIRGRR